MHNRKGISYYFLIIVMVAMMAWPAIVNGQPFFFPDTTTYVRSADFPIHLASGGRISTVWTRSEDAAAHRSPTARPASPTADQDAAAPKRGNDLSSGFIMGGRSPYFGFGLYLTYVLSNFWLFVAIGSILSLWLIRLALRAIGIEDDRTFLLTAALLALLTPLPFYTSYLLADIFAGLGMLALAVLAASRGPMGRRDRLVLAGLVILCTMSHPTHVLIILAMTVTAAIMAAFRLLPRANARFALGTGAVAVALAVAGTMLTNFAIERTFGHPPHMAPLLTARFIGDGPGARYIREYCPGADFTVCRFADRIAPTSGAFLWSTDKRDGVFLFATDAERKALSAEDIPFALAVLKAYPIEQAGMIVKNSLLQAAMFDDRWLNYSCKAEARCWRTVPEPIRQRMAASPAGRGLWPTGALSIIHYGTVGIALLTMAAAGIAALRRRRDERDPLTAGERAVWAWIALIAVGLAVNAFLGGALSDPQSRYQGRVIWLVPFTAWMLVMARRQSRSAPAFQAVPATPLAEASPVA